MKAKVRHQESVLTQSRHAIPPSSHLDEPSSSESKKTSRPAMWLFFLALSVGLLAVVVGVNSKTVNGKTSIDLTNLEQRRKLEASVNRHIQMTNRKIETERERIKIDAAFAIPRVGHLVSQASKEFQTGRLELKADRGEYNSARDVDRRGESTQSISVSNVVHNDMAEAELQRYADEAYRKEYARQYIESARRNGYDVQIDANYRVISVKELPPGSVKEAAGEAFR